jgi:hypothetical protein
MQGRRRSAQSTPRARAGRTVQRTGNGSHGITAGWSVQHSFPKTVALLTSPVARRVVPAIKVRIGSTKHAAVQTRLTVRAALIAAIC